MGSDRCVMAVHAHPDDEATKGGATMSWFASRGVRTVLVTCTDGSAGDVTDPSLVAARTLAEVRAEELSESARRLGFAAVHQLGYRDSGMDGAVDSSFAQVPIDRIVDKLVALMHEERPAVVVTYDPAYAAGHPAHARCHDAVVAAFGFTANDADGPQALYGTRTHSPRRLRVMHDWLEEHGQQSPYAKAVATSGRDPTTTRVRVDSHVVVAREALRAHRSQVRVDDAWFFAVPDEMIASLYPWEDFQLLATAASATRCDYEQHLLGKAI